MEDLRCKSCGSPIDPSKAVGGVVACEYCGNKYTLPKSDSAAIDAIRQGSLELDVCDFDRAYTAFKRASELDKSEPEAFWGMALAEFRVQYLNSLAERPDGRIMQYLQPICHEVSGKIFSDSGNYKKALSLATPNQRAEYERRAKEIDYIRKEFFALKSAGEGYDCFICVKVSDPNNPGRKTDDNERANQMYYHLRDKGYRVFFSEREIQNKTGVDYEARILYALYSSNCMIVICSNEEYLQTQWVKNEYTRFLRLINDEEKASDAITIAFHGTPIERLPGKNGRIQGVNLANPDAYSKIEDYVSAHMRTDAPELTRKVYGEQTYKKKTAIKSQVQKRTLATYAKSEISVSERGRLEIARTVLQSRSFDAAINRCKDIVSSNQSCSEAYWIMFLAENGCTDENQFAAASSPVTDFTNLETAIATGTPEQNAKYYGALFSRTLNDKHLYLYKEFISLPDSSDKDISKLTSAYYSLVTAGSLAFPEAKNIFDTIIKTVTNTDKFIKMNMGFAEAYFDKGYVAIKDYYRAVLDADAGNHEAQFRYFCLNNDLVANDNIKRYCFNPANHAAIESNLYSYGFNKFATDIFMELCAEFAVTETANCAEFFSYVTSLIPTDYNDYLVDNLGGYVYKLINNGNYEMAKRFNEQLLGVDKFNYEGYFNRVLINRRINNALWLINDCENLYDDPDYSLAIDAYGEKHAGEKNIYITIANELKRVRDELAARPYYPFGLETLTQEKTGRGCEKILAAISNTPQTAASIYEAILEQQANEKKEKAERKVESKKKAKTATRIVFSVLLNLLFTVAPLIFGSMTLLGYLNGVFTEAWLEVKSNFIYASIITEGLPALSIVLFIIWWKCARNKKRRVLNGFLMAAFIIANIANTVMGFIAWA